MKQETSGTSQATHRADVFQTILQDHQVLKTYVNVMKDKRANLADKKNAFMNFSPALKAHAHAEEQAVYVLMEEDDTLRMDGLECGVEHQIVEELIDKAAKTLDEDLFCAQLKVIAELVEHHLKEEEERIFNSLQREFSFEEMREMSVMYEEYKRKFLVLAKTSGKSAEQLFQKQHLHI